MVANSLALTAPVRALRSIFSIPPDEREEFMQTVAADERALVNERLRAFREIACARTVNEGCAYAAGRRATLGRGWTAKTLRDLYRVYLNGGYKPGDFKKEGVMYKAADWRLLLRDYKAPLSRIPEEFVPFWINVHAGFRGRQDCVRAAWRHLVHEIWLVGKPVDGYGTIDEWCRINKRARPNPVLVRPGELPDGWTMGNLRHYLPKRKADKKQISQGYLAAHTHQPDQVLGDRSTLLPFERVFMDDVRPDIRGLYLDGSRGDIVYPLMILALDCASGVDLANVIKPRALKDPESKSKARHGISRDMTLLTIVNVIRRWGLPPWPVTFVHENGGAALETKAKQMLEDAFGDRVRLESTAMFKEKMLEHGFEDGGGCPWDKAQIEAFFRILQTQIANMAGTTGPRYDTAHGELREIEKYTLGLIDRAGGCAEIIRALSLPLLRFDALQDGLERALHLLRFRTMHALQGFDRLVEWRRGKEENYQPEAALMVLPQEEQDKVTDIITRLECPAERFVKKLAGVVMEPQDPDLLDFIAGPHFTATVRDGKFAVSLPQISAVPVIFREPGHTLLESDSEGKTYDAVISLDGERIILGSEGRFVGTVRRQDRVAMNDREAIKREAGRVKTARLADRETLRGYMVDTDVQFERMRRDNEILLTGAPMKTITRSAGKQIEETQPKQAAAVRDRNAQLQRQLADRAAAGLEAR